MPLRVLDLGGGVRLSLDLYRDEGLRVLVLARSGAGKSNLAALVVEQLLDANMQVVVVEPIPEYHTLRLAYPVVIIGEDGDVPVDADAANVYGEMVERGLSCVVTVGDLDDPAEEKRLVAALFQSLYQRWKRVRRPLFLVVEEADEYAPQMWSREDRPSLAALAKIAKRGRKLGINMVLVTQRPADIHKSIISQSNVIFIGSFTTTQDLNAVKEYSRLTKLPIPVEELGRLRVGEFFMVASGEAVRFRASLRRTPHGGVTPEMRPLSMPDVDLSNFQQRIAEIVKRVAEEKSLVASLRRENEELKKRVSELEKELETVRTVSKIPVEVKVEADRPVSHGPSMSYPEVLHRGPTGVIKVYEALASARSLTLSELCGATGFGFEKVRRAVVWLGNKRIARLRRDSAGRIVEVRMVQ